ncbi:MAG: class I SAM-dependent methyltransferase [Candidatus Paceibacterota bacterium]|jgi:SAM-dependent methyltransferase
MKDYTDFYKNGEYFKNNPGWHEEDSEFKSKKIIEMLEKNKLIPTSVAEVGCGFGEISNILSKRYDNVQVSGFDISEQVINIAKKKESHNLHFFNEDIISSERSFDLIIMADVFEHVRDYIGFIDEVSKHSRYSVFHIPLDISIQKILFPSRIIKNRKEVGHLHYFIKETALETLKDCDLEILDCKYTRWGIEMKQKSLLKKIGKLPLILLDFFSTDLAAKILGGNSLLVLTKKK